MIIYIPASAYDFQSALTQSNSVILTQPWKFSPASIVYCFHGWEKGDWSGSISKQGHRAQKEAALELIPPTAFQPAWGFPFLNASESS